MEKKPCKVCGKPSNVPQRALCRDCYRAWNRSRMQKKREEQHSNAGRPVCSACGRSHPGKANESFCGYCLKSDPGLALVEEAVARSDARFLNL